MSAAKQYFKTKRVSNSYLTLLEVSPPDAKSKLEGLYDEEDAEHFRIGSGVDCLLTAPEDGEDEFIVVDIPRPSGMMDKFVAALPSGITNISPEIMYEEAYQASGYKLPIESIIDRFWRYADNYRFYKILQEEYKTVLSPAEYNKVQVATQKLLSHKHTRPFFVNEGDDYTKHGFQTPIYWEYNDVECKSLMDGVMVDEHNGTIQPFDLKTTGRPIYFFRESFIKGRYFRQAAFYLEAMKSSELLEPYKDFTWLPFRFVVVESDPNSKNPPLVYRCTDNDLKCGKGGGVLKSAPRRYKGFSELIDDYKWHLEEDKWEMPRDVYYENGEVELDLFN